MGPALVLIRVFDVVKLARKQCLASPYFVHVMGERTDHVFEAADVLAVDQILVFCPGFGRRGAGREKQQGAQQPKNSTHKILKLGGGAARHSFALNQKRASRRGPLSLDHRDNSLAPGREPHGRRCRALALCALLADSDYWLGGV
ncbi:hypothetical protein D3C76_1224570 [compost metagenome]